MQTKIQSRPDLFLLLSLLLAILLTPALDREPPTASVAPVARIAATSRRRCSRLPARRLLNLHGVDGRGLAERPGRLISMGEEVRRQFDRAVRHRDRDLDLIICFESTVFSSMTRAYV